MVSRPGHRALARRAIWVGLLGGLGIASVGFALGVRSPDNSALADALFYGGAAGGNLLVLAGVAGLVLGAPPPDRR